MVEPFPSQSINNNPQDIRSSSLVSATSTLSSTLLHHHPLCQSTLCTSSTGSTADSSTQCTIQSADFSSTQCTIQSADFSSTQCTIQSADTSSTHVTIQPPEFHSTQCTIKSADFNSTQCSLQSDGSNGTGCKNSQLFRTKTNTTQMLGEIECVVNASFDVLQSSTKSTCVFGDSTDESTKNTLPTFRIQSCDIYESGSWAIICENL